MRKREDNLRLRCGISRGSRLIGDQFSLLLLCVAFMNTPVGDARVNARRDIARISNPIATSGKIGGNAGPVNPRDSR